MKLNIFFLTSAMCFFINLPVQAAQELTSQKAAELKPFDRITITGRFNNIGDAIKAVSARADGIGADYFYIQGTMISNNGGNIRVIADVYHKEADKIPSKIADRLFNGIRELSKEEAKNLQPFDTVTIRGHFNNLYEINNTVSELAKRKDAAAFYITRQVSINAKGGNQAITAFIYKTDAPKLTIQNPDAIPANSETGQQLLKMGGKAADKVEVKGLASSATQGIGNFYETQSSKGGRYTVTLKDGTKIEELNNEAAAQMTPFDSITFTGYFKNMTEMSEAVAKRAADKDAKYYHITRQWQKKGGNVTISADLFK